VKKFVAVLLEVMAVACAQGSTKKVAKVPTVEKMYETSINDLNKKRFRSAADGFEQIEELYAFTPHANKSVVLAAYSHYKAGNFDDSLKMVEYFKKINFDDSNTEYMFYLEILNKAKQVEKSRKDLEKMKETIKDIDNFLYNYPNSEYGSDVQNRRKHLVELAIKNELNIATYYINRNNLIGSLDHLNNVVEYLDSKYAAEILYRIFNLYKHINYEDGYKTYYGVLRNNYSNTKWFRYANSK
jgi:outer membrane protein assembly factor BamD